MVRFLLLIIFVIGSTLIAPEAYAGPPLEGIKNAFQTTWKGRGWPEDKLGKPWWEDLNDAEISFDDSLIVKRAEGWEDIEISVDNVKEILKNYLVVSVKDWSMNYVHDIGHDKSGMITLSNGEQRQWVIRPGGLALIVYPEGFMVCLASEISHEETGLPHPHIIE